MGSRGPAPTPTKVLQMRGSWRAKERSGEPQPESGAPEKPEGLSPAAARAWDEVVPALEAAGILSTVDGAALRRYVQLLALWVDLQAFLEKSGHAHPVKNARGEVTGVKAYPQVRLALQVSEHLLRLEQQYGLTPAARARLATGAVEQDDGAESAFGRRIG